MWSFVVRRSIDSISGFSALGPAVDARAYLDMSVNEGARHFNFVTVVSFDSNGSMVSGPSSDTIGVTVAGLGGLAEGVITGTNMICAQPGAHTGYASQWCNGADDSTKATPVHVSKNESVRADSLGKYHVSLDTTTYLVQAVPWGRDSFAYGRLLA